MGGVRGAPSPCSTGGERAMFMQTAENLLDLHGSDARDAIRVSPSLASLTSGIINAEAGLHPDPDRLGGVARAEAREQGRTVHLDGLLVDAEPVGDLFVEGAADHLPQHL